MDRQLQIDFDSKPQCEIDHVAIQTPRPVPAAMSSIAPPPLVRPDRQIIYVDALSSNEWPDASSLHDRDPVTIDRIRDDIDGPSHRFVIKRWDSVEVFFSSNRTEIGEVIGISHANEQVCVKFPSAKEGTWFSKGQIYPAVESIPKSPKKGQALSRSFAGIIFKHGAGLPEADPVEAGPSATSAE